MATWGISPASQTTTTGVQCAAFTVTKTGNFSGSEVVSLADFNSGSGSGGGSFFVNGSGTPTSSYTPPNTVNSFTFTYENSVADTYTLKIGDASESPTPLIGTCVVIAAVVYVPSSYAPAQELPTPFPLLRNGIWQQLAPPPYPPAPFTVFGSQPLGYDPLAAPGVASVVRSQSGGSSGSGNGGGTGPGAATTYALKFDVLPDGRGVTWRAERSVIDSVKPDSAAGVWLDNLFGILCTRTVNNVDGVWWITSANPDDAGGWKQPVPANPVLTSITPGQVWGLALNSAGVLCALVGTGTWVSRDRGLTWHAGGNPGGMDSSKPATVIAQQHLLIVVQPHSDSTAPTHWVSVDGGATWK